MTESTEPDALYETPVPWRDWAKGTRVMVRHRLPQGDTHPYTDVLGVITQIDGENIELERRDGTVAVIKITAIVAGKPIPPAMPRRRPRQ